MTSGVHFHVVNDASFDFQCDLKSYNFLFELLQFCCMTLYESQTNRGAFMRRTGNCCKDFTPLIYGFVTLCPAAMPFHWVVLEHFGPSYLSVHTRGTQCNMRDGASGPWLGLLASLELRFHGNPSLLSRLNISFPTPLKTLGNVEISNLVPKTDYIRLRLSEATPFACQAATMNT